MAVPFGGDVAVLGGGVRVEVEPVDPRRSEKRRKSPHEQNGERRFRLRETA